jgi:hypothetical protein
LEAVMIKPILILKRRREAARGQSLRSLRRAMRPAHGRVGWRVVVFLILLSLVVGWIGISVNLKLEAWEREHSTAQHEE